jgi:antagonist of KipI
LTDMFKVLAPGAFTTVQDAGRYGFQQYGVPVSGVLDQFAHRVANWLVGNQETAAVLEITFVGPSLEVLSPGLVAVTGADVAILVNGVDQDTWESFAVRLGDTISFRPARRGVRAYLAVSGGIDVPEVMGSRSTYISGRLGGFQGRALEKGDIVQRGDSGRYIQPQSLTDEFRSACQEEITLRCLPGPQDDYFDTSLEIFFNSGFTVSPQADRMGYRLDGPLIELREGAPSSIISEPSLPGMVQVPADGRPIIILVEQTVGGYAKIATIITPDLDLVAQARPGDLVRFRRIDLEEAYLAHAAYRNRLNRIKRLLGVS